VSGLPVALWPAFAVVCGLLIVAGIGKLRAPQATRDAVRLTRVPVPAGTVRALGAAEVALGTFALIGPGVASCLLVAAVYGLFAGFVLVLLRSTSRPVGCGCFGDAESGAGWIHVVLNGAAFVVAILATASPPPHLDWLFGRSPVIGVSLAIGTAAATFAGYLAYTAFPGAWRSYGSAERA